MKRGREVVNIRNQGLRVKPLGVFLSLTIFTIFLSRLTSAQFFGGYGYGGFSLTNFFSSLDPSTVVYSLVFFIFFTIIFLVLTRVPLFRSKRGPFGTEDVNSAAAGVVSFAISALIVYYMYRNGYSLDSVFYNIGFSGDITSLILSGLVIALALFIVWKFKIPGLFITLGTFLILIGLFTDFVYEKNLVIILGLFLILIGLVIWKTLRKWWKKNVHTL